MPISEKNRNTLMKNNAEINLETRNCIKSALLSLLKTKKFDEIRMTDIIRKSGISRMGVYNNYKSKEAIMVDLYKKPLDTFFSTLDTSLELNLEWIFQKAYQHKDAARTLIDAGLAHIILDMMNDRFKDKAYSFYISMWIGLLYNAVIQWIKSDTDETPETAVARLKDAMNLLTDSIKTGTAVLTHGTDVK